jgi:replicative superfamily II helicase
MPTGSGKSVFTKFFSVATGSTSIQRRNSCHAEKTVLYAVPTVALVNETYTRLHNTWRIYGNEYLKFANDDQKHVLLRITEAKTVGCKVKPL